MTDTARSLKRLYKLKKPVLKRFFYLRASVYITSALLSGLLFTGCTSGADTEKSYVLTTGLSSDEVFKLEDRSFLLGEAMLYLVNMQNRYESVYGDGIWESSSVGEELKASLKDNVLSYASQIKAMNILAAEQAITLDENELSLIETAADDYYSSLSSYEIKKTGATPELIRDMYTEYALAGKYYRESIKDIDREISDDEARTITVLHIFIDADTDKNGSISTDERKEALKRAEAVHLLATDGEHDFMDLTLEYSDGTLSEYSFKKGDTDPAFEDAAFNLGNDEISDVITTPSGYHIIKCINTFNREETDLNKLKMLELAKEESFGKSYDEFAEGLVTEFNEPLWDSIEVVHDDDINTQSFFEVYHKYQDQ